MKPLSAPFRPTPEVGVGVASRGWHCSNPSRPTPGSGSDDSAEAPVWVSRLAHPNSPSSRTAPPPFVFVDRPCRTGASTFTEAQLLKLVESGHLPALTEAGEWIVSKNETDRPPPAEVLAQSPKDDDDDFPCKPP